MANVNPVPEGYDTITPGLTVRGGAAAIDFYKKAFGAEEVTRMAMPDGSLAHAELRIGDSRIMLGDEDPAFGNQSPEALNGTPVTLVIYVEDADAMFTRALAAGATEVRPMVDQFYGDRTGTLKDPFGHQWTIGKHIEDVSPEEMDRRMAAWAEEAAASQ